MDITYLDHLLTIIEPWLAGLAVLVWVWGVISHFKRRKDRFLTAIVTFMVLVSAPMLASQALTVYMEAEINGRLFATIDSVDVDGKRLASSTQLIEDLRAKDTSPLRYHHSHPTNNWLVTLHTAKGDLILQLARDSGEPQTYWLYYPRYYTTAMNDIGFVHTSALDHPMHDAIKKIR